MADARAALPLDVCLAQRCQASRRSADSDHSRPSCLVPRLRNRALRMPSSLRRRGRLLLDVVEHLAVLEAVLGDAVDRPERIEIDGQHLAVLLDRLEERGLPGRAGNVVVGVPEPTVAVVVGVPSVVLTCSWLMPDETCCRSLSWNWWPCFVIVSPHAVSTRQATAAAHSPHGRPSAAPKARLCHARRPLHGACRTAGAYSRLPPRIGWRQHQLTGYRSTQPFATRCSATPVTSGPAPERSIGKRPMLAWLKERGNLRRTARSLYGSIVTQARSPGVYAPWGVPDTPEGRFEMIVLHLVLVLRRLASEGERGPRARRRR